MKFREVDSCEHGTSCVLNLTHPDGVLNICLVFGVGSCASPLLGGTNTEQRSNPTIPPINIHSMENIITLGG